MEQHVCRRKKNSLLSKALVCQPAGRNFAGSSPRNLSFLSTDVIKQIKQKPARIHKNRVKKQPLRSAPWAAFRTTPRTFDFKWPDLSSLFEKQRIKTSAKKDKPLVFSFSAGDTAPVLRGDEPGKTSKAPGFPLGPVLAAAAVLLFSLLMLNWQHTPWGQGTVAWNSPVRWQNLAGALFLEGPALLEPREDGGAPLLAAYAGLSPLAAPAPAGEDIPLDLMETFAWTSYKVQRGDSVSKIAASHALSLDAIIASNGISNARSLQVGKTIKIPNMDGIPYTVKNGDSLAKISAAMGVPLEAILDANDIQSDSISQGTVLFIPGARMKKEDLKLALGELFIYPIKGRLTSPFGWRDDPISGVRRHHAAMDLAAPMGTPIKAAMDGKVATVGYNSSYGNYVIISHANSYQTMYAHLSLVSIKQGANILQGSKIGEVGSTGYSTGPHLHFAVYKNGRAVNPLEYLNK
ncbi:hypothetical protein AGMMS49587_01050 [Spirochaetia bacterium]|nr:hypothetical protein AGMMS49587_01050 [Spirochaetia bacterium]